MRPIKVMAKGLHSSCDEKKIIQDLKAKGLKILEAKNIIKKEKTENSRGELVIQRRGLPMFRLTSHHDENIQNIYNIRTLMGLIIKIEPLRKTFNLIPQCKRCQPLDIRKNIV